jgi:predicted SAM-dependent methyltransferase
MEQLTGTDLMIDLACGDSKREGFIGIDKFKTNSTDHVFDILQFPWPIADECAKMLHCSHFFEHIPKELRPKFMDEAHRVLQKGGQMVIIVPYWSSMRSIQDFNHEWPPVSESSFLYFNKNWRTANRLTHGTYEMTCDFDFGYGYILDQEVSVRNQQYQTEAVKFYNNSVLDLHVTLTRR